MGLREGQQGQAEVTSVTGRWTRQVLKEGTACQEVVRAKAVWPVVAALSLSRW